ncbi:MAG: hypothetical protein O8C59_02835 [Candidatus Methanoperedens sp.]|nr:hypothetical protein [Candidatus Methanoperedens sp.]
MILIKGSYFTTAATGEELRERRFCKHIGALMLALPEDAARGVLEGIKGQQWEFSQYTGRGEA